MRVCAKPPAGADAVFIDDAQIAEPHVFGIVVIGKRESVIGIEPTVIGVSAGGRWPNSDHSVLSNTYRKML